MHKMPQRIQAHHEKGVPFFKKKKLLGFTKSLPNSFPFHTLSLSIIAVFVATSSVTCAQGTASTSTVSATKKESVTIAIQVCIITLNSASILTSIR